MIQTFHNEFSIFAKGMFLRRLFIKDSRVKHGNDRAACVIIGFDPIIFFSIAIDCRIKYGNDRAGVHYCAAIRQ